ncbi:MAG: cupin domain-containing protein [Candidatus Nezhaarchaeales archaeon]
MIVARVDGKEAFRTIDGSEVIEVIGLRSMGIRRLSIAIAKVQGHTRTLKHRHNFLEVYYIEKGKGKMHIEEEERLVCKGDFIVIPEGYLHYIENVEDDDLIIWCICVPAFTFEGTKLEEH